jgi:hypothetical protein
MKIAEVETFELSKGDPADLTDEEVKEIRKEVFN